MKNVSQNGELVHLEPQVDYLVIDTLYLEDIKEYIENNNDLFHLEEVRDHVFEFMEYPFAEIRVEDGEFLINRIIQVVDIAKVNDLSRCFASDSGLIILIKKSLFKEVVKNISYEMLTDHKSEILNLNYWEDLSTKYLLTDLALILAPGINCGFDFTGSGLYLIR
ncbi:MAG: hypothetical protein N4A74_13955 [Carboxylicivirga sp.]|jgi:hypothetical protein|nr:hypothetical protein [Carboxylicivirga sp.]